MSWEKYFWLSTVEFDAAKLIANGCTDMYVIYAGLYKNISYTDNRWNKDNYSFTSLRFTSPVQSSPVQSSPRNTVCQTHYLRESFLFDCKHNWRNKSPMRVIGTWPSHGKMSESQQGTWNLWRQWCKALLKNKGNAKLWGQTVSIRRAD